MGRESLFYEDARAKHKKIQLFTVVLFNSLTDSRQQIVFWDTTCGGPT